MPTSDDGELLRLLDNYAADVRQYARDPSIQQARLIDAARAALLAYLDREYVRRDDPRYRVLDRASEALVSYTAARGAVPRQPGDESPEDTIRRLRDSEGDDGN